MSQTWNSGGGRAVGSSTSTSSVLEVLADSKTCLKNAVCNERLSKDSKSALLRYQIQVGQIFQQFSLQQQNGTHFESAVLDATHDLLSAINKAKAACTGQTSTQPTGRWEIKTQSQLDDLEKGVRKPLKTLEHLSKAHANDMPPRSAQGFESYDASDPATFKHSYKGTYTDGLALLGDIYPSNVDASIVAGMAGHRYEDNYTGTTGITHMGNSTDGEFFNRVGPLFAQKLNILRVREDSIGGRFGSSSLRSSRRPDF